MDLNFKSAHLTLDLLSYSQRGGEQKNLSPALMGILGRPKGQNLQGYWRALWLTRFVFL